MLDLTGYKLTFDDEFNSLSAGMPGTKGITWETSNFYGDLSTGNSGTVNPTPPGQPGSQFSVSNGVLNMAISPTYSPYLDTNPNGVPGGFSQEYGYFEMNAKLTGVSGYSDAFWLLPNSGPWPPEIDIEEHPGSDHNEADFTNHGGDINTPVNNLDIYNAPDLSAGFHTYGLMWTPTTLTWYFDGDAVYSCPTSANEHQAMNVILSAYANKGLGYVPDVQPGTSDSMQVNWVHVYSNNGANPEIAGQANYQDHNGSTSLNATPPPPATTPPPSAVTVGTGPDSFALKVSEDAYANHDSISDTTGDARFKIFVDGKQQGGTFDASALHKAAADQTYTINGTFGPGPHTVAVQFVNDAYGPHSPDTKGSVDRNLYVDGVSYDGTDAHQSAAMASNGTHSFKIAAPSAAPTTMTIRDDAGASASVSVITNGTSSFKGSLDTTVSQSVANGTDSVSFDSHVGGETVQLGSGTLSFAFHSPMALILTGGSGTDTVTADSGPNRNLFTAGTGSLDVSGGNDGSTYFFHANSGALKIEDFNFNDGDSLGIDKSLQGAFKCVSDGHGGSLLTFGTTGSIDLVGHGAVTAANIGWS